MRRMQDMGFDKELVKRALDAKIGVEQEALDAILTGETYYVLAGLRGI
jgi:hypothetical protein